jgi:hypothetical protein
MGDPSPYPPGRGSGSGIFWTKSSPISRHEPARRMKASFRSRCSKAERRQKALW